MIVDTKLVKILTDLGLEAKQAKIYLSLLELGEATVQEVAKQASVRRTSAYYILDQLREKGLVFQTKSKKRTYYIAEDPNQLLKQFRNKTDKFADQIKFLEAIHNRSAEKPRIYLFKGKEGFRKILQFILDSNIEEYLIITDPREFVSFVKKGYIERNIISKKTKRNIRSRQLIAQSEYAKQIMAKDKRENRVSKCLPYNHTISFTTIIFGNKVALISPFIENNMLIIESEAFAKTQRSIFEILWEVLPE